MGAMPKGVHTEPAPEVFASRESGCGAFAGVPRGSGMRLRDNHRAGKGRPEGVIP